MSVKEFMRRNFRHFNARETLSAAIAYGDLVDNGGKMLVSLAVARSTEKIGLTLAAMIRWD